MLDRQNIDAQVGSQVTSYTSVFLSSLSSKKAKVKSTTSTSKVYVHKILCSKSSPIAYNHVSLKLYSR